MISEICEAFGCVPSVAEQQDLGLIKRIFDYRNLKATVELLNKGDEGTEELKKHPELGNLLVEIRRARGY